jgi:hypothetical protein
MKKAFITIVLLIPSLFFTQKSVNLSNNISANPLKSNIIAFNVNTVEKLVLKNALYDISKENLPYFQELKQSSKNTSFSAAFSNITTLPVTSEISAFIKKTYGKFISSDFQIINQSDISGNDRINVCKIIPFRINPLGNIEELISYQLRWSEQSVLSAKEASVSPFKNTSVLSGGRWHKIAIAQTGMYRLDQTFFTNAGINLAGVNPKNIRIYGNGGGMIAERNSDFRYDDLEENAIQVLGEEDNVFNAGDAVIFYAQGTVTWKFNPYVSDLLYYAQKNIYTDTAYYFLTFDLGPGKRVNSQNSLPAPADTIINTYDYYAYHDRDLTNFVKSGRNFFGEYFDVTNSYNFNFSDNNFVSDTIRVETVVAGRGNVDNTYNISGNGIDFNITCNGFVTANYLADYAVVKTGFAKAINTGYNSINLTISKLTPNTIGYLDRFTINARRELTMSGSQFSFRDQRSTGNGKTCEFIINVNGASNLQIWNVSDRILPVRQSYITNGNSLSFIASSDTIYEYTAFRTDNLPRPVYYGTVANQNLHALQQADYIIVTPPQFLGAANRLGAIHQREEGLTYAVVTTNQVYNEFGSGKAEATAIRDFTRMLYSRGKAVNRPTRYLLLFGRGSYYNKNGRGGNTNFIPTYQNENSVSVIYSVASDDFYGLMDPNEGIAAESFGFMDIGVGRIINYTTDQANDIVNKIDNYYRKGIPPFTNPDNCAASESNNVFGDWRNHILFSADDGDGALHMTQADNLANKVRDSDPAYIINKVYIDAYKGLSTPGGKRYPDMQAAFNNRVQKGCLIMNYTGHGGEVGLAAERVVDIPTINSWVNFNSLPLFITATCEFSRYDDPDRISAGELCLINPKGGSIALLTTCRLAFSNFNETLNNRIFDYIFKKQSNNQMPTLGDIIRNTKFSLGQNFFYSNFHLLGDPALTLAYPKHKVNTSHINGKAINISVSDTIKGLSKVTVNGILADSSNNKLNNFNGIIYPVVYDKSELITCQLNDASSSISSGTLLPFQFKSQQNIIYRGKAEVKNGDFRFSFVVPKDVSFNYGNAKFSYYATDGNEDAHGTYDSVKVGGLDANAAVDNIGPVVKLFLNSRSFVNGGTTSEKPILLADVADSSGINTVGTGFGHDITAVMDENTNKPIVLNDFYEADLNSFQTGKVRYQLQNLEEGPHTITFKIWDVQNNSSTTTSDFVVAKTADLALNMVLNYPNPFTTRTQFFFEHNRNCEDLRVTIQVFTVSGKLAKSIQTTVNCEGFRNEGISWDGRDDYGDKLGRGVYLYKLTVTDKENKKAEKIEKLVILN